MRRGREGAIGRRAWGPLLLVATLAILVRLPLALAGPDTQLSLLADDASYYLEAARRAVDQRAWPSMDGVHPTNGFHPLYMALQVGLQATLGCDPRTIIPWTMGLHLALNAAVCLLLAGALIRRRPVPPGALVAAVLVALAPGWLAHGFAGLETSLSAPLVLLAALRWIRRYDPDVFGLPPLRSGLPGWLGDGALLGLAMLARTDAVLFAAPYLLSALALEARRGGAAAAVLRTGLAGLVAGALVAPWLGVNIALFGSPVQDSALALGARYEALHGPLGSTGWAALAARNALFWVYRLGWIWGLLPLTGWLAGLAFPWDRLRRPRDARWPPWLALGLAAAALALRANDPWYIDSQVVAGAELLLGLGGLAAGLLTPRTGRIGSWRITAVLGGYLLLSVVVYSGLIRSFQLWYTAAPALAGLLLWTLPALARVLRRRPALAACLALLVAAQLASRVASYRTRGAFEGRSVDLLERGEQLSRALEETSAERPLVVGSFDSGELSYRVHPFPVVNLDGVMNHGAAVAIQQRALARYLEREGVTHIIGPAGRVEEFQRVSPFEIAPDAELSARLGTEISGVVY